MFFNYNNMLCFLKNIWNVYPMQFSIIPVPESGNPENKKHDTVQLQGVGYVKPEHHAFLCAKAGKKPV